MGRLREVVERHGGEGFEGALAAIGRLESEYDATVGELRSLVGSAMAPEFTGLEVLSGPVVGFYETADAIVNHAEAFARELAAMAPVPSEPIRDALLDMIGFAREAVVHLARAATARIEALADPEASAEIGRDVEQIRALEGRCDGRKHDRPVGLRSARRGRALAVHELIDAAADAVEDAADRLTYIDHAA